MQQLLDVVVIGAGPAGSATAYYLAKQGVKVALIDKATFPRDKACGDILSPTALRALERMGLSSLFADYSAPDTWSLHFGPQNTYTHTMPARYPTGLFRWAVVPRRDLDATLMSCAQGAGARIFEGVKVEEYTVKDDQVQVVASGIAGGELNTRLIIIAEGSAGRFARPAGSPGVALRGYFKGPSGLPPTIRWLDELAPGGYEWQFPVTDTLYNIGTGTAQSNIRNGGPALDQLLMRSPLVQDKEQVGHLRGGLLNYDFTFRKTAAHADRVLRVGDAAGLVQPHLGEGIGEALRSGEIAAECAVEALGGDCLTANGLADYTACLHNEFDRQMGFGWWIFQLMKYPRLWQAMGSLVAANHSRLRRFLKIVR